MPGGSHGCTLPCTPATGATLQHSLPAVLKIRKFPIMTRVRTSPRRRILGPRTTRAGAEPSRGDMIRVSEIDKEDAGQLCHAFLGTAWERPLNHFDGLLAEHESGLRTVLVARLDNQLAGHASIFWKPAYPYFRSHGIPEIQDLNVVPRLRRRRVASRLLDEAEKRVSGSYSQVGISFGLHPGYGAAQRLYVMRGYVPDGQGVFRRDRFPGEAETVVLDDHLLLHLVKNLR